MDCGLKYFGLRGKYEKSDDFLLLILLIFRGSRRFFIIFAKLIEFKEVE
jgi:hypothetical protein